MKIKNILEHLEQRFPLSLQEDFDNCGVQCGDVEQEITGVLVCFEMSEKVIEEAVAMGANLVISHHPLILRRGICKIEPKDRVGGIICKALAHRMVLYSMHTNIDSAEGGGNDAFAERLGLTDVCVLVPAAGEQTDGSARNGLGRIGQLPQPMPEGEFLHYVKERMGLKTLRYISGGGKTVRTVAVCGGGGSSFIEDAGGRRIRTLRTESTTEYGVINKHKRPTQNSIGLLKYFLNKIMQRSTERLFQLLNTF